jgi:hypothetical protein
VTPEVVFVGAAVDTIAMIRKLVPERSDLVERAYRQDLSFRSLCRDYRDCDLTLERLRRDDAASAAKTVEYAELLEELGREIREWLRTHGGPGDPC